MSTSALTPTPEQQSIIDAMSLDASCMANARAGCSKSTTLQMAAPKIKVPALGLAFNKKIAMDLIPRMPQNFSIKTFNAFGHGVVSRLLATRNIQRVNLDDRKIGKLVTQLSRERKMDISTDQWGLAKSLVTKAMSQGLVPDNHGTYLVPDDIEVWRSLSDELYIDPEDFDYIQDLAKHVLERSIALFWQGQISFDDQIYGSICLGGQFPQFPVIFVDEAQDLSPLNHEMLARALRAQGKLVTVGDEAQAIYAFRGASGDSMSRIRALRQDWVDRPLNTTFRCPKVVVARVQWHVPGFTAWHSNPEGSFAPLTGQGWTWDTILGLRPNGQGRIAVLCRNNAPLLSLAFKLLRQRIGVTILGRDFGKGLVSLSKRIAKDDSLSALETTVKILEWKDHEYGLAIANDKQERAESIEDQAESLLAVLSDTQCQTAGQLRALLTQLFENESSVVTLSSIHRAKGLEWETVLHLDPSRVPSRYARIDAERGNPIPLVQEHNLQYVCETRTKHTLIEANLEDFNKE